MPNWKGIIGLGFDIEAFRGYFSGVILGDWRPEFIVLHNTEVPSLARWHDYPGERRMKGLEQYYRDEAPRAHGLKGWSAGPHLFIADDLIWAFTPLNTPGVHSPSWNDLSWGFEMVGNYDKEPFGDDVKRNTLEALAIAHRFMSWTEPKIRFHREDPLTDHHCPGNNVVKAEIEAGVQVLLDLDK